MPIYEYRCNDCHRRVSILIRSSSESPLTCPSCGGGELTRLFSSFSVRKSDQTIYDDILSDSRLMGGLESDDPRALAEWNSRMSQGEQVGPEYEEAMDNLKAGQWPDVGKLKADHAKEAGETSEGSE
ncbi:zinc ribbon domain-containing protein [Chloroflexota bacterium]